MESVDADVLVLGGGLAGLSACLHAPRNARVVLLEAGEGSSFHAQGGVAAAIGKRDSTTLHARDTLAAGAGLCDRKAVSILVKEGVERIGELVEAGAPFDVEGGRLSLGLEAAHSARRILHCSGDDTGRVLTQFVRSLARERACFFNARATSLLCSKGRCFGAVGVVQGEPVLFTARATVLATGGYAGLFSESSNDYSLGGGIAFAHSAGARLCDLEFVQFHPTVVPGKGFLVSESLRGEGAVLVNQKGERFMKGRELLARDVVARDILSELNKGNRVFLDATGLGKGFLRKRFPSIDKGLRALGIDFSKQPVPVGPAAHYCMGGVLTDVNSRSSLKGLYACGEAACTRVHGANRLASNSLLEAIVFGARAGANAGKEKCAGGSASFEAPPIPPGDEFLNSLRRVLWRHAGVVRSRQGLGQCLKELSRMRVSGSEKALHSLAVLVAESALRRRESRGSHFREDFPRQNSSFRKHTLIKFGRVTYA